ncbi:MAG: helix-turn-helix domain-containing protein [Pseudomonadales bacterium]
MSKLFLHCKPGFGPHLAVTNVELADLGIRVLVFGQFSIVIVAALLAMRNRFGAWLVILSVGLLAYIYISSEPLVVWFPVYHAPAHLLASSMPWVFWFFIREGFELQLNSLWIWGSWLLFMLPKWVLFIFFTDQWYDIQLILRDLKQLVGIAIVIHALYQLIRGYNDDLVEKRRLLRKVLGICTGLTILSIMAVEFVLDFETQTAGLNVIASSIIAILTLLFAPPILTFGREVFARSRQMQNPTVPIRLDSPKSQAQQQLHLRLNALMEEGAYRDAELTIGALAERMSLPEHQLRKLINSEMGFRNFSAFIQNYRIAEVCEHLQNPDKARIPILTLALDAGFGSLGPFNRAFKSITGVTPSEYRDNPLIETEKP